jgi:hypothetical protein
MPGTNIKGGNGTYLANGTDVACIDNNGNQTIPTTASTLQSIAGGIASGPCP